MAKFVDAVAFFSYNPGGVFSGGGMEGAGSFKGKKEDSGSTTSAPGGLPAVANVPQPASFAEIEAQEKKKLLVAQQRTTKTILTSPLGVTDGGATVQKKILLGS